MTQKFDLIIRGGKIVDGSGGKPFIGDVAIAEDRIVAVGTVDGRGKEEIDATGLIVFDEDVKNYVQPSTRQGQLFRLLHAIEKAEVGTHTDFTKPFHHKVLEGAIKCSDCHNPHGGFELKQARLATGADAGCGAAISERGAAGGGAAAHRREQAPSADGSRHAIGSF